jgi:acyl-coenzyme A thioesterase PaaI-like protein
MSVELSALAEAMLRTVPFAGTLGVRFEAVDVDADGVRCRVLLPDRRANHNHVGGPHAGALFALGETASGAVVLAAFGTVLDRAVPLAVRAEIAYRRLALGDVWATARLGRPAAEVMAELDAGVRPEFPVHVEIATADGVVTAELTVAWTLRPTAAA